MINDIVVSVIVPIYNAAETIERCVDSILEQTLYKIEVILVNDGSTDRSANICDVYAEIDQRVRVIHMPNRGVSAARNSGLSVANGEYITFVDSDDYIEKRMLEQLVATAKNECLDIVISGYKYIQLNGNMQERKVDLPIKKRIEHADMKQLISKKSNQSFLWFPWNKLYRRKMISDFNIKFKEGLPLGEDALFNMQAFLSADGVYYVDMPLYNYVQTEGSATQTKYKKDLTEKLENLWREKIRICEVFKISEYEISLAQYTLNHTLPMLIQNELAANHDFKQTRAEMYKIRNCEMISFAYKKQKGITKNKSLKMIVLMYMLKYRMYTLLAVLFIKSSLH